MTFKKSKLKPTKKQQVMSAAPDDHENLRWLFVALAVVTLTAPFFRGAFFSRAIMTTQMALVLLFTLWMFRRTLTGSRLSLDTPMDWVLLWLAAAYLLPVITFQWADLNLALEMIIWQTVLFLLYRMVHESASTEARSNLFQDLLIAAGVVLAGLGLLALAGYVDYPDAVMGRRIASTFQYPNTLAALTMSFYFLAAGRQLMVENPWRKSVYQAAGWLLLLVFVLTYSRIAWLLLPVFAVSYWLLVPRKEKIALLFGYTITAITLLFSLQPLVSRAEAIADIRPGVIGVALVGMGASVLLYLPAMALIARLKNRYEKVVYGLFLTASVVIVGVMLVSYNATEPLEFDGKTLDENRTQNLTRLVSPAYPGDYFLALDVTSEGGTEEQWPWIVDLYALDEEGATTHVLRHRGEPDESGELTLPFTIPQQGEALRLVFRHQHPGTRVTFDGAQVLDDSGNLLSQVPLRYTYLPENLVSRFQSIDRAESSASTRIAYYRDGLKIFADKPLTGSGGGAWQARYDAFQSEPYSSRLAHNYFLQTMVETGIPGLMGLLSLLGILLARVWKAFRKARVRELTLLTAILALLAHSTLDFNFSYFSIAVFFWVLIALLPKEEPVPGTTGTHESLSLYRRVRYLKMSLPAWTALLLMLPLLVFLGLRLSAFQQQQTAVKYLQEPDKLQEAYDAMDKAVGRNPFHPNYRANMIRLDLRIAQVSGEPRFIQSAQEHLDRGLYYAPNNYELVTQAMQLYVNLRETQAFSQLIDVFADKRPLKPGTYSTASHALNDYARLLIREGNDEEALQMLNQTLSLPARLHQANEIAHRPAAFNTEFKSALHTAKAFVHGAGQGVNLKTLDEGLVYTSFPVISFLVEETSVWRTWGRDEAELTTNLTEQGLVTSNAGTDLGIVYTPNLPLEPETTYEAVVSFTEVSLEKPVHIHIIATDSEEHRVQFSQEHDVTTMGLRSVLRFTTSNDIDPSKDQYLRVDHPGNDPGTFTIQGIYLFRP